jgi:hypothetical protein
MGGWVRCRGIPLPRHVGLKAARAGRVGLRARNTAGDPSVALLATLCLLSEGEEGIYFWLGKRVKRMIKEIPGKLVLFQRHVLNSPMEIGKHVDADEPKLRSMAKELGLEVAGPLEHAYWDMTVKGAPHLLEIWLPVMKEPASGAMPQLKKVSPYKCLTLEFKRPIDQIGDAWMELGDQVREAGHTATNHDREVYRVMDCDNPLNNDIELQIGIK